MKMKFMPLCLLGMLALSSCGNEDASTSAYSQPENFTITAEEGTTSSYSFDSSLNAYVFTSGGDYIVEGTFTGSLIFEESVKTPVQLTFLGVSIDAGDKEAIIWKSEDSKLEIKAKKDTVNSLSTESLESNTIYSKNNVEFSGKGTLSVYNEGLNAISASDIEIHSGITMNVTSKTKDCFHAKSILIHGGNITATAKKDVFEAEWNMEGEKADISIEGGNIHVSDSECIFNCNSTLHITGEKDFTLTATNVTNPFNVGSIVNEATNYTYTLDGESKTI